MNKIKVEIEIPELNLVGEMKPVKSKELLQQFENILIENKLSYRLTTSAYREEKLSDEEKQEIRDAALEDVFETQVFNDLPLSAQDLYCNLSDMADENGCIYDEPNKILEKLKAKIEDVLLLSHNKFIIVHTNKILIFALAMASADIEWLEMSRNG